MKNLLKRQQYIIQENTRKNMMKVTCGILEQVAVKLEKGEVSAEEVVKELREVVDGLSEEIE